MPGQGCEHLMWEKHRVLVPLDAFKLGIAGDPDHVWLEAAKVEQLFHGTVKIALRVLWMPPASCLETTRNAILFCASRLWRVRLTLDA
eukprot:10324313-Alexandrium_andersonii.AAC.1